MAHTKQDDSLPVFKDTLNLPHTDFPIRSNPAQEDALLLERWEREKLYSAAYDAHNGAPRFILHDGPPYANGHLHLGHAYNKILKDIVSKAYRMRGFHVPVKPGWDCHGLPIELKVTQEQPGLERNALIKACRAYASNWITIQRAEFKQLGVLMDWDRPYSTMSPSYESSTVKAFGKLVGDGFIERKNKTVPWCAHCHTVLAAAEYEYKERKDPSIYVTFQLKEQDSKRLFSHFNGPISVVVWTTTPWTLPLNQAVLVKPHAQYVLIDLKGKLCIVGAEVADILCNHLNAGKLILAEFTAEHLSGLSVLHPFIDKEVPLLFDDSVGVNEGTAFVHCAPGCGPSDYEIGVKNNLEIYSPISAHGLYTELIQPQELVSMPVSEGQWWVIKKLDAVGSLLYKGTIKHSYPHCWRCHNGLIFRATPQWFFNLEHNDIRKKVLSSLETLSFIPAQGKNFLRATVESRWEWCLSRQRAWGCPIPAVLCEECDYAYLDQSFIEHVAQAIAQEGIEYWNKVALSDLPLPSSCPQCKGSSFKKETDIIDVWFESGVSHYAELYDAAELAFPASLYLEGIDQYRAWFQSSLITSIALEGKPCTTTFMSHGYTVDEKGQKMSKSLGNVVTPQDIIKQVGTDGLRLWVSSIGNDKDPVASATLLRNVAEVHRKIRNTCRFLLSNIYDFTLEKDAIAPENMLALDRYALTQLSALNHKIITAYTQQVDFTTVFHVLADYCTNDLSAFYLDIVKDRLYCDAVSSHQRRSSQTALWYILDTLTRLIAPILSFTAEQIADHYQKDKKDSIHLQQFIAPEALKAFVYSNEPPFHTPPGASLPLQSSLELDEAQKAYELQWQTLKDIRSVLLKALEEKREAGLIKHSLEAALTVYIHPEKPEFTTLDSLFNSIEKQGQTLEEFFKEFLIVSQFTKVTTQEGLNHSTDAGISLRVDHAQGVKCPRCWRWSESNHPHGLDKRCEVIVEQS